MRFRRSIVSLTVVAMVVSTLALDPLVPVRSEGAGGCTHVVKDSGSGATKYRVCVSAAGNLVEFQTPAGEALIHPTFYEGYHLCSDSTIAYDHSINAVSGFAAPVLADASPLTINRTTSNGVFTVTQIFQPNPTERDLKITMKVKNNSGVTQTNVSIGRGWDAGTGTTEKVFGGGYGGSVMFVYSLSGYGLMLTLLSVPFHHATYRAYTLWASHRGTMAMCAPSFAGFAAEFWQDWFATGTYGLGTIAPGATKTVILSYRKV
jgi:hypothetical protein